MTLAALSLHLLGRLAAAGKCDDVQCNFKELKLQR
jgi:hypothetical protein